VSELPEIKAEYAQPLRRLRYTQPQIELDRRHRHDNMRGAFALEPRCLQHERLKGASILLLDDVCTTTATLAECARVLRAVRPQAIYAVTIARQL
jgi:predicted amidophosphoribosyltransferase